MQLYVTTHLQSTALFVSGAVYACMCYLHWTNWQTVLIFYLVSDLIKINQLTPIPPKNVI